VLGQQRGVSIRVPSADEDQKPLSTPNVRLNHPSGVRLLTLTYPINGACHRIGPDESAFAYRDATFATVIAGMWPDPAQTRPNIQWLRDYYEATAPRLELGGYMNFMSEDDQGRMEVKLPGKLRPPRRN
jgi:hypothetical protein